ncbi:Putative L-cysteine desulfhydrase 1-like protein [Cladobotryum mycophilum]|uniref:L-cysteine desulfhydrase 1-like protein n=1 Tax=Cladobotryum mycophilum TaxID=491253 RepID=A0ABR0S8V1_9HYPO
MGVPVAESFQMPSQHVHPQHMPISDTDTASASSLGNWQIRQDILYLDNGAFGACPVPVWEKQKEIRQWIDENPHEFFERAYIPALEASRAALADFLHVNPYDLALMPGATYGLNTVIQSLRFNRGDEILTTNHAYSSVRMALEHVAKRDGARVVVADIPLVVASPDTVLQKILSCVTPQTRFAVIDHVPSRSGMIFPIKRIVSALDSQGVDTLVDGAHAPGMIPLDIEDINAAYYVANCHKWMCSPRGVGFLHVRCDRIQNIKPLVIARSPYVVGKANHTSLEHGFTWLGTNDPSAMLSLPSSIDFLSSLFPGGYRQLTNRNHNLAVQARSIVCKALGISAPCPDDMIGAMATIPLPDSISPETEGMLPIQQILWRQHKIVIPVYSWPSYPKRVIRLSVQAYNSLEQYLRLAHCLQSVLYHERNPLPSKLNHNLTTSVQKPVTRESVDTYVLAESVSACGHDGFDGCASYDADNGLTMPHQDIEHPTTWLVFQLSKLRIQRIAEQKFASYPLAVYPTAKEVETQFATQGQPRPRHANLEISRMTYMLSCVDQRRIPQITIPLISKLLATKDIIQSWPEIATKLRNQTQTLTRAMMFDMDASRTPVEFPTDAKAFISDIVPYATECQEENLSLSLWLRALADFTSGDQNRWSPARIESFLQIHAFLKDPVGGLRKDAKLQRQLFASMISDLKHELNKMKLSLETWEEIAAQLAMESSFLSHAKVQNATYIHFSGDEQLVYSYVEIDELARSEFASPAIVMEMLQDMMNSPSECVIAPIMIAHGYPICSRRESQPIIIDGNNRITSIIFLRFISVHGVPDSGDLEALREYCRDHGLGSVCFVDLCAVLQLLWESRTDILSQLQDSQRLSIFRSISQVPALITEESSFITKRIVDEGESILQPIHQSILASDDVLVGLPAKMQLHGRSKGFKPLPVR